MKGSLRFILTLALIVLSGLTIVPGSTQADAPDFEVTGWIPYWRVSAGTRDAKKHLDLLTEIHPFGYAVTETGGLNDLSEITQSRWRRLIAEAREEDVRVIPTVMWSDGTNIHRILSDTTLRGAHIQKILRMVRRGKFDGVDIDYEAKLAETNPYFALFLKELKTGLGEKMLTCAIEARTPPDSLYKIIPATLAYSNDYAAIGTYCDRVQLMTYDQRRADLKLNAAKIGAPYIPVADTDWVRKVVQYTLQSIPKEKIVLGVATYGHEYEVTVSPNWFQSYRRIRALNQDTALDLADELDITPSRSRAGELAYSYIATSSSLVLPKSLAIPNDTPSGNTIAARALAYANATGKTIVFNYVTWSDADAIEQKIDLIEEFGLRGLAIFKIDGSEDSGIWDILEDH